MTGRERPFRSFFCPPTAGLSASQPFAGRKEGESERSPLAGRRQGGKSEGQARQARHDLVAWAWGRGLGGGGRFEALREEVYKSSS